MRITHKISGSFLSLAKDKGHLHTCSLSYSHRVFITNPETQHTHADLFIYVQL